MKVLGKHLILELKSCCPDKIDNLGFVRDTLEKAVDIARVTLLRSEFHKFSPQGVSGVVLIAESHISVHTWPEECYVAIDFFTCGDSSRFDAVIDYFVTEFESKEYHVQTIDRGC